jgi:hypothetical protein
MSVEDDKHSGRPSTSKTTENIEKIRELINEYHCCTIHVLTDTVGISYAVSGDINRKSQHALHRSFIKITCPPTHP